jgi:peptidoglycan/xylan/chitin deacetylase (PgdA/CDA1 family)
VADRENGVTPGFNGTFYVNPGRGADDGPRNDSHIFADDYKEKWSRQVPGWQAAAARGHEVGNHTVDHPCSCNFDFGTVHLEGMALADIAETIDLAERRLDELIPAQAGRRSFCYPCYQTFVGVGTGKQSYVPVVAARFGAARGGGPGTAGEQGNNPAAVDLAEVWGADVAGWTAEQLIAAVDGAIAAGRWLVLVFHGVGGAHTRGVPSVILHGPACCLCYLAITYMDSL